MRLHPFGTIIVLIFSAAVTGALVAEPATVRQQERPLDGLAFMAGCWRGDGGVDKNVEEQWTAADSDVMLATTRYVDENDGHTLMWEFSRIVADSGRIVLIPAPMGNARGRFRMTSSGDGEARFEDPSHDYPRRIIYRRADARTLVVYLDGGEGSMQAQEFRLASVPCPAPPR